MTLKHRLAPRRIGLVILSLACLLCLLPAARAAQTPSVTLLIDCQEERVLLRQTGGVWYLDLPSGVTGSQIAAGKGILFNEPFPTDGWPEDEKYSVTVNGKAAKLRVLPSEQVGAMFIDMDRLTVSQFKDSKRRSDTGAYRLYDADGTLDQSGLLSSFSLHGNSTLKAVKKSFNLKLTEKRPLLGMEKDRSWALISNAYDNSCVRNFTALTLAESIGIPYTPDFAPVDLYVNQTYLGAYLLTEKVQVGKGRVEIFDLGEATEKANEAPLSDYPMIGSKTVVKGCGKYYDIPCDLEDISGGYLMELDLEARYDSLSSAYVTERGQIISIKSPKYLSKAQFDYISALLQQMENALFSEDGVDPATGKRFEDIVDLDSAVRKYILEELVCNFDANKTSQFFYKAPDRVDPKIYFGPAWDYDMSLGNRSEQDGVQFIDPEALAVGVQVRMKLPVYYQALYRLLVVRDRLSALYREANVLKAAEALALGNDPGTISIDQWSERISSSVRKNYNINPHRYFAPYTKAFGADVQKHVDSVKDFLLRRARYLDALWCGGQNQ